MLTDMVGNEITVGTIVAWPYQVEQRGRTVIRNVIVKITRIDTGYNSIFTQLVRKYKNGVLSLSSEVWLTREEVDTCVKVFFPENTEFEFPEWENL